MNEKNIVKGYKVFTPDWTCRGFKYEVGQIYEMDGKPKCCERGFHFCTKAADCFQFYNFDSRNKVAEVEALGDVDVTDKNGKCCTNKIHIIRELTWHEVLDLVNSGKNCTGLSNSGNRNSGDFNSGDFNSGNRNSGDFNSGNRNSGDFNSGNRNSGDYNSGDFNSGDYNSGDYNSGDFNSGDFNSGNFSNGCFNTESPKIYLFNKLSEWTYEDWLDSDAICLLNQIPVDKFEYIYFSDMTDEEKTAHLEAGTTGGYLKLIEHGDRQKWWNELLESQKDCVKSLPNFDAEIFKEITGIDVNAE